MVTTYQYRNGTERPITVTRDGEVSRHANGNVVAVRSPRYFDSGDTLGYQQASEAFSYTRRNLKATHTAWNRTDGNLDQAWSLSLVGNWATFTERN